MPRAGSVTLDDLRQRGLDALSMSCAQCDRSGRYSIGRAIERWGADAGLPDILAKLSADCPRRAQQGFGARCGAKFDGL